MKKQIGLVLWLILLCIAGAKAGNSDKEVESKSVLYTNLKMIDTLFIKWIGNINSSWATPGNWLNGSVPTENDDIIIPSSTAFSPNILNGTIGNCNSIKLMAGAVINVATGGILKIRSGKSAPGTPDLITTEASLITNTSAQLGGSIISIGNCALLQHGVVISRYNNPTTNQTAYPDVSINGTGNFNISVGLLLPATKYFARAYATNCKGTSYGNEITFTTTGGGGGTTDTGYFRLITGGITYFSYDLLSPKASTIFPEGDTRFAVATWDNSNQVFSISANSSFLLDVTKSFGFDFGYGNPDVHDVGTYTFGKSIGTDKKVISFTIRSGIGANDFLQTNYNGYLNTGNFISQLTNLGCEQTEITSAINTLIINRWGNPGEYIEGTINGTLYENIKTLINCSNSLAKPFVVEFKLKRLQ